jgi:flagellin-like hook-associated protein FlgL
MADVVLSGAMRSNLLSMQNTAKLLDQTQQRVATGLKVNSAIDNPQSFFTAQGLDNRASDLSTLLDSMGLAVQTLKAASQGIDAIQKLVQQAKATAIQALQTTITPSTSAQTFTPTDFSTSAGAAKTMIIQVGTGAPTTVTLSTNVTSVGALQAALTLAGVSGVAVTSVSGNIQFSNAAGQDFTVSGTAVGGMIASSVTADNGVNRNAQVDTYNALLDQIDQLASDASFNGINLLQNGTELVVNFNERQSSQLNIKGIDSTSAGLKLDKLDYSDFATNDAIKAVQETDDKSTQLLRTNSTGFASSLSIVQSRQDFTNNLINTLKTGSGNLTLADTNEEGANLLSLQTRQQLGTSALSIANQSQQSILKLF